MTTLKQIITAIIAIIVLFTSRYIYQPTINRLPLTDEVAFDTAYILAAITTMVVIYIFHKKLTPLQLRISRQCNHETTIYELFAIFIIMKFFSMVIVVVGTYTDNELITAGNINTEFSTMGAIDILFLVISSSIVAPIIEEIIFRGILLNALGRVMSVKGAVLVSSAVFGLLHRTSVATVVTATVMGVVLACIYLANRNLVNSMVVHGLYNFLALLLSYKAQIIDPWLSEVMGSGVGPVVVVLGGMVVYVAVCVIVYRRLKGKYRVIGY